MRLPVLVVFAAFTFAGCRCLDPSSLEGFSCESDGGCGLKGFACCADSVCRVDCNPRDGGSGGAGAGGGSGGSTGVGGGDAAGGGDGGGNAAGGGTGGAGGGGPCTALNCTGCCEGDVCRVGTETNGCGKDGTMCTACEPSSQRCQANACVTLAVNSVACTQGSECVSGNCVGNLCCNSACGQACATCGETKGTCTPRAEGTADAGCAPYACNGVGLDCPTTCTSIQQCSAGRFCGNGMCQPVKTLGTACASATECSSGFCSDGVCCAEACSGSCDRCNLSTTGSCDPAPANDPGTPACGGALVCNGTLRDCPILCTAGCPASTYCSGTYCSAKKAAGLACASATECSSAFCVSGVCCDSACTGSCQACSVATGAPTNGTCTNFGPSRVCRAAAGNCDVAESCNSTPNCPANGFSPSGQTCAATQFGTFGLCLPPTALVCSATGTQSRSKTESLCNGTGTCQAAAPTTDVAACSRSVEGSSCGSATFGAYSACSFASVCATTGTRTRMKTEPLCQSGSCQSIVTTETDTAGCPRATEGTSCGAVTFGTFGTCGYANGCSNTGSRSRTKTTPTCTAGACANVNGTDVDATACARNQDGTSCGAQNVGAYTACSYANACSNSGSRTRQITTYTCGGSACGTSTTTETDTAGCARSQDGSTCGATSFGAYTACSYGSTCANGASRIRQVTTFTCSANSCGSSTSPDIDTVGCGRNTNGTTCGTAVVDPGTCSYAAGACTNVGSRTETTTSYSCSAGACASSIGSASQPCSRNTEGVVCATRTCTACGPCAPDCIRERDCTDYACAAGVCGASTTTETCGSCPITCSPM